MYIPATGDGAGSAPPPKVCRRVVLSYVIHTQRVQDRLLDCVATGPWSPCSLHWILHSMELILCGMKHCLNGKSSPGACLTASGQRVCTHICCVVSRMGLTGHGTLDSLHFWSLIVNGVSLAWYWLFWGSHIQSNLTKLCLSWNTGMVCHSINHTH
jgi:hypothetical protein